MERDVNNTIFLLLGSNQGRATENLDQAKSLLAEQVGTIQKSSSLYRTAAWGKTDQPDFYNQVIEMIIPFTAAEALEKILSIEKTLGRVRFEKWGIRNIDIDILFFGSSIVDLPHLTIPHPAMAQRRFTLVPLAEVAPDFKHPILNKRIQTLLEECKDTLAVERVNEA